MMYQREKEHNPPHVHAFYGDEAATFFISNGELYDGAFPNKQRNQVKEFILAHKNELQEMWDTGIYKRLEGAN